MKWLVLAVLFPLVSTCGPRSPADQAPRADQRPSADQPPNADQAPPAATVSLDGREWILFGLGERTDPLGAGGRPATIQFDPTSGRAAGFAGCNRYSAGYTLTGDSLKFGPAMSTKMACADGDELERSYLAMLRVVTTHQLSDSTLILKGAGAPVARFRAP